jgi:hypothetical protein
VIQIREMQMQMFDALRTYVKSLLLEQERNEEQEIDSIKELFQHWIDEYSVGYLAFRKKVRPDSWNITQISVKEADDFVFISPDFEERIGDDWFIVTYNKENKNVYCIKNKAFSFALGLSLALPYSFAYYIEQWWINKVSVDQFHRVMDVTKGNYAQFEVLVSRLSDLNKKNTND